MLLLPLLLHRAASMSAFPICIWFYIYDICLASRRLFLAECCHLIHPLYVVGAAGAKRFTWLFWFPHFEPFGTILCTARYLHATFIWNANAFAYPHTPHTINCPPENIRKGKPCARCQQAMSLCTNPHANPNPNPCPCPCPNGCTHKLHTIRITRNHQEGRRHQRLDCKLIRAYFISDFQLINWFLS